MPERIYNPIATFFCCATLLCLYILAMIGIGGGTAGSFAAAIGTVFVISAFITVFVLPWIPVKPVEKGED